ncbi:hypothetical protein EV363DRAFT_1099838, partial [Boletus edulis]
RSPSRARMRYFSCDFSPGEFWLLFSPDFALTLCKGKVIMIDVPRASEHPFVAC